MAFITNEKREGLIKRVNESYALKKAIVLIEIIALLAFIVLTFVSLYDSNKNGPDSVWKWFNQNVEGDKTVYKLTGLGIGMTVYAVIIAILGIISVVLVFTLKSPKTVKKEIKTLEGSALSGKRIKKSESAGDIMRERRNPTVANPNFGKKKKK